MMGWAAVDAVDLNLATIAMLQEVPKVNTRTTMSPRHGGGRGRHAYILILLHARGLCPLLSTKIIIAFVLRSAVVHR